MWRLDRPTVTDAAADVVTAMTYADGSQRYPLAPRESAAIAAVYEAYDRLSGEPGPHLSHPDLGRECVDAVERGYEEVQKHGRLSTLRSRLMLEVQHCPSRGFGEVTQLDHFLPKSAYKVLAIYPRNLVPSRGCLARSFANCWVLSRRAGLLAWRVGLAS